MPRADPWVLVRYKLPKDWHRGRGIEEAQAVRRAPPRLRRGSGLYGGWVRRGQAHAAFRVYSGMTASLEVVRVRVRAGSVPGVPGPLPASLPQVGPRAPPAGAPQASCSTLHRKGCGEDVVGVGGRGGWVKLPMREPNRSLEVGGVGWGGAYHRGLLLHVGIRRRLDALAAPAPWGQGAPVATWWLIQLHATITRACSSETERGPEGGRGHKNRGCKRTSRLARVRRSGGGCCSRGGGRRCWGRRRANSYA
jgi:hypothetical protein